VRSPFVKPNSTEQFKRKWELVKLNQLKDDFLSTVSHEFGLYGQHKMAIFMLTVAGQDSSAQQSQVRRYLQILQDESAREINLINDLLNLQRLETGKQTLMLEKIHLQTWLMEVIEPFKSSFAIGSKRSNLISPHAATSDLRSI